MQAQNPNIAEHFRRIVSGWSSGYVMADDLSRHLAQNDLKIEEKPKAEEQ
jgi:hypothetical protein